MRIGQRVRIVEMDGCMAHVRGKAEEGIVIGIIREQVYGDTRKRPYAQIALDNGRNTKLCAEPQLWTEYEGAQEYRI